MKILLFVLELVLIPLLLVGKGLLLGLAIVPAAVFVRWAFQFGWFAGVLSVGPAYYIFGLSLAMLVVMSKWVLFYRAREGEIPFICVRTALWALTAHLHDLARFFILHQLRGTWLLVAYFRLMGAHIGRNVIINSATINDWDLVHIDDDTMIGDEATITAHVGEKGMLKFRPIRIGKRCTIARDTAIFPGVTIEDDAIVAAMTVVPKGRTLEANSVWGGTELRKLRARGGLDVVKV